MFRPSRSKQNSITKNHHIKPTQITSKFTQFIFQKMPSKFIFIVPRKKKSPSPTFVINQPPNHPSNKKKANFPPKKIRSKNRIPTNCVDTKNDFFWRSKQNIFGAPHSFIKQKYHASFIL